MKNKRESCDNCSSRRPSHLSRLGISLDRTDYLVALAGNPNTGKSTVFNNLTGLRQHTGNWPGKTVTRAEGGYSYQKKHFKLVDLPGTYSLLSTSTDEEVARDFILFGRPDVTVIVADATRLERNLNLALQILEITDRAVLCLNLTDEAARNRIEVDEKELEKELGIPVVRTAARSHEGMKQLVEAIRDVATGSYICKPHRISNHTPGLDRAIRTLSSKLETQFSGVPHMHWVALRLLEGDQSITDAVRTGELGRLSEQSAVEVETAVSEPLSVTEDQRDEDRERERIVSTANSLRWNLGTDFHDTIVESIYGDASRIARKTVRKADGRPGFNLDMKIDRIVTSRWFGFPIMFLLLALVFWITVSGANYPSRLLSSLLIDTIHPALKNLSADIGIPWWLGGVLIDGAYLSMAWVVSVMLPPMAIFFPLFTLLEDLGYLPRVAFNMDHLFRRAGAHGKQALTLSMGFGCNAAGVIAARVIDSPRERLIAIITNNFSLCNGRWPTQILIATIFIGGAVQSHWAGLISAGAVVGVAVLGILFSLLVSAGLSRSILKGEASAFSLELPPYRPPRILQTLYTSLIDRTIFVLWRAIIFALPAGILIWLVANIQVSGLSVAEHFISWADPFALLFGLNGVILLAYIIAIPANEIVIPTVLMLTVLTSGLAGVGEGAGVMFELDSTSDTEQILYSGGWTLLTAVNLMLFSLLHNPCSTTLYTIYRETRSVKWTLVSAFLPLLLGLLVCFFTTQVWLLLAG